MKIVRGRAAGLPYASVGDGRPILVCSGVWTTTGADSDSFVRSTLLPIAGLARSRRLIVLNRRPGLRRGISLGEIATEYTEFVHEHLGGAVDVLGVSTGGSIAQQLAAEHPDAVRRLILVSTACRLSDEGRRKQADVAAHIRDRRHREAAGVMAGWAMPFGMRRAAHAGGRLFARQVLRGPAEANDLATTLEAEDAFDLSRLPGIGAPTLIIGGSHDVFYNPTLFAETALAIPGSELLMLPRGHGGVLTDRRARAAIARFLAGEPASVVHA